MNQFYQLYPEKFNNKTNGIAHRRWLLKANPKLSTLITESIGESWTYSGTELSSLLNFQHDTAFLEQLLKIKNENKRVLADIILDKTGVAVDTQAIFDVQVKRLHAYKRQLLNVLHIMHLYNKVREDSSFSLVPEYLFLEQKHLRGIIMQRKLSN